jgi:hypothetical protein
MTTSLIPYSTAQHVFRATYTEGPVAAAAMFFKEFIGAAFSPYRPEEHYMRGPGPACRAKASTQGHGSRAYPKT